MKIYVMMYLVILIGIVDVAIFSKSLVKLYIIWFFLQNLYTFVSLTEGRLYLNLPGWVASPIHIAFGVVSVILIKVS
jgi:hypothetical protein